MKTRDKVLAAYLDSGVISIREIAKLSGVKHNSTVYHHLERLRKEGRIPDKENRKRCPTCNGHGRIVVHNQFLKERQRN